MTPTPVSRVRSYPTPQPHEEFDIETATATTRVHACRPNRDGTPVVLLSGAGFNASNWYPHVEALAKNHPVYGIDMPGDPNPSIPRALMTPPASCAAWLDELLFPQNYRDPVKRAGHRSRARAGGRGRGTTARSEH